MPETQIELAIKLVKLEICNQQRLKGHYNCIGCPNRKFCRQYEEVVRPIRQREEARRLGL